MSRLKELISQIKSKDPQLGDELEREIKALPAWRFGLNFERDRHEIVELPNRIVREGDKVRVLPERGTKSKGNPQLWLVKEIKKRKTELSAVLDLVGNEKNEKIEININDLVVIAEFQDYIYPGLIGTGKVERDKDKPFHTVINGENYHALKALTFTHKGKIDAIYIDPPYNTGAKDWKYNNDYVESEDLYRHSKWLAFMERRLRVAKKLLNPKESVLIVTIDEKEYLRLGLLLEQIFPDGHVQMISSVINSRGVGRANEFARTNEFIFTVKFGSIKIFPKKQEEKGKPKKLVWETCRRRDLDSARGTTKGGPAQFYPIYVNKETGQIASLGEPLAKDVPRDSAPDIEGCIKVFPVRPDGTEMNWGLIAETFQKRLEEGYARAGRYTGDAQPYIIQYLKSGVIKDIEEGRVIVKGKNDDGSVIAEYVESKRKMPTTQWQEKSHNAEHYGTRILKCLIPKRRFPFPKSLYAVEDILRYFLSNKTEAIVLDFFAGSGTTAHAIMRLNKQDGGKRQAISITNNEVSADEQALLLTKKLRPGDEDWEKWGICDYITKPRIKAAITGKTHEGKLIKGNYKFTDKFPMSEGFKENAEFFTLTYETPKAINHKINHNQAFLHISPLLWMRAGSQGRRIEEIPENGWELTKHYGILFDLDKISEFCNAINSLPKMKLVYIVTNDEQRFQSIIKHLHRNTRTLVESIKLDESYLKNFQFTSDL